MRFRIFKFGGASVRDAAHIKNVYDILGRYEDKLIVIISAMGKTTNALETHVDEARKDPGEIAIKLQDIVDKHTAIAAELGIETAKLENIYKSYISDASDAVKKGGGQGFDFVYDQIVSLGELFSTHLVAEALSGMGQRRVRVVDARDMISTDANYKRAEVDIAETALNVKRVIGGALEDADILIVQGFIGRSEEGFTTTLGREGSDYTAALVAYSMDAEELTIWKDVPGILTADPRRFENVDKIDRMSYQEAIEMTYYGAKVIHPKTIQPIQNKGIRMMVNSYMDPEMTGTIISEKGLLNYPPIVVMEDDVILIEISSNDFSFIQEEHLSYIFRKLNEASLKLLVMRNSAISFTICIRAPRIERLNHFLESLGDNFSMDVFKGLELLTIRHYKEELVKDLTRKKIILFEESIKDTVQLVLRPALEIKPKSTGEQDFQK